jgi:hypothetical protein
MVSEILTEGRLCDSRFQSPIREGINGVILRTTRRRTVPRGFNAREYGLKSSKGVGTLEKQCEKGNTMPNMACPV